MNRFLIGICLAGTSCFPTAASSQQQGPLSPFAFLVGDWASDGNNTGPGATGTSSIRSELNGRILVRRDHVMTKAGVSMDFLMVVYPEKDAVRADFLDTEGHVIHYSGATPAPGTVVFLSDDRKGAIRYRLSYHAVSDSRLHVTFETRNANQGFRMFAEGDLVRTSLSR